MANWRKWQFTSPCPVYPRKQTPIGRVGMSAGGQSLPERGVAAMSAFAPIATELRTSRDVSNVPRPEVAVAAYSIKSLLPRDGTARVTLEVLLCGRRRYRFEVAIGRQSIQKCENWVRVRADRPLPPLLLLRILDEPGPTQGNDKSPNKAGSVRRPSWLPRLPHRN